MLESSLLSFSGTSIFRLLLLFSFRTTLVEVDASLTSRTVALGLLPPVLEKRLLASEKAMHPSRV